MWLCCKIFNPEEEEEGVGEGERQDLFIPFDGKALALSKNQTIRKKKIELTKPLSLIWDSAYSLRMCPKRNPCKSSQPTISSCPLLSRNLEKVILKHYQILFSTDSKNMDKNSRKQDKKIKKGKQCMFVHSLGLIPVL